MSSGNIALSSKIDLMIFVQGKLIDNNIKKTLWQWCERIFHYISCITLWSLNLSIQDILEQEYTHALITIVCFFKGEMPITIFQFSIFTFYEVGNNNKNKNMIMFSIKKL